MKKEYFGKNSLKVIPEIITKKKSSRIFLVTGKNSFSSSGAKKALDEFFKSKKVTQFSRFSSNPKLEEIIKGIKLFKRSNSDMVIAVGGGSAIDMAKLINILACQENRPKDIISGKKKISKKGVPLIAVPTTAGSGSEATHFAVLYAGGKKYSLAHKYILPDFCVIEPFLTYSMPPYLTAVSGFDALAQAIESYWAVKSTQESKKYAACAIKLIIKNIKKAVCNPNPKIREKMAYSAHLAGKAINISKTTAAHAISYRITMDFNIPHGHAVALSLGKILLINSDYINNEIIAHRGRAYLEKTMKKLYELIGSDNPKDCAKKLYLLMRDVGLSTSFRAVGIVSGADIQRVVAEVDIERMSNNPVKITRELLRDIIESDKV